MWGVGGLGADKLPKCIELPCNFSFRPLYSQQITHSAAGWRLQPDCMYSAGLWLACPPFASVHFHSPVQQPLQTQRASPRASDEFKCRRKMFDVALSHTGIALLPVLPLVGLWNLLSSDAPPGTSANCSHSTHPTCISFAAPFTPGISPLHYIFLWQTGGGFLVKDMLSIKIRPISVQIDKLILIWGPLAFNRGF